MYCHNCGKMIPDDSLFCPFCGSSQEEPAYQESEDNQTEPIYDQATRDQGSSAYQNDTGYRNDAGYQNDVGYQMDNNNQNYPDYQNYPNYQNYPENQCYPDNQQYPGNQYYPDYQNYQYGQNAGQAKKGKGFFLKIIISMLLLSALAGGLYFVWTNYFSNRIDMNKYLKVEFSGEDGEGYAYMDFDYDLFYKDNKDLLNEKLLDIQLRASGNDTVPEFLDCFCPELDKDNELKNGDKIHLSWNTDWESLNKKFDIKVKADDKEFTVSGLSSNAKGALSNKEEFSEDGKSSDTDPNLVKVDIFDYFVPVFKGDNSSGYMSSMTTEEEKYREIEFTCLPNEGLSNGDLVTVTVADSSLDKLKKILAAEGKAPLKLSRDYEVYGLDDYAKKISEIEQADLAAMKKKAEILYKEEGAGRNKPDQSLRTMDFKGIYFLLKKDRSSFLEDNNTCALVYQISVDHHYSRGNQSYSKPFTFYWYISFSNLIKGLSMTSYGRDLDINETPLNMLVVDSGIDSGNGETKKWRFKGFNKVEDLKQELLEKAPDDAEIVDSNL